MGVAGICRGPQPESSVHVDPCVGSLQTLADLANGIERACLGTDLFSLRLSLPALRQWFSPVRSETPGSFS